MIINFNKKKMQKYIAVWAFSNIMMVVEWNIFNT